LTSHESLHEVRQTDEPELLDFYLRMLEIRMFEEKVLELRARDAVAGSVHLCIGQESVPVGALAALGASDPVVATYRGHGWAIASGLDLEGLFAEILGRAGGVNGGRAGSPYLSGPGTRFLGENSIVGAGLPSAVGAALAARHLGRDEVAIVSFGDGATNQGASHEAIVFAIAEQLPVIFVCENNGWSEMTPIGRTVKVGLAERASGYGLPAVVVDGSDVQAVYTAVREAQRHARSGAGPSFLEVRVPRILGHYNADIEQYRPLTDKASAADHDPIAHCRVRLIDQGIAEDDIAAHEATVRDRVADAALRAEAGPTPDPGTVLSHITSITAATEPTVLPESGRKLTYALAINEALRIEMSQSDEIVLYGEDVAIPGGVFGVTRGLLKEFGERRVFDTPIAESAILGSAVGASRRGLRPVVEIMWADFLLVALDQLINQAANVRYLSEGRESAPLLVRTQQGVTAGSCAQHSQSLESLLTHIPGLKVGMPSTPHDAFAMTRAAIRDDDPVVMIESRALYTQKGVVDTEAPVESVAGARWRRRGSDLLIVSWGRMVTECLTAAAQLAEAGIEAAVLDLRWLAPLDFEAVASGLRESGKILIVHEANQTGGFGGEIAARVSNECFELLDGPVTRLGAPDLRWPAAPALQNAAVLSPDRITEAALRLAKY
jgi:2-oxoisovalerate dehydrogenase E1 component